MQTLSCTSKLGSISARSPAVCAAAEQGRYAGGAAWAGGVHALAVDAGLPAGAAGVAAAVGCCTGSSTRLGGDALAVGAGLCVVAADAAAEPAHMHERRGERKRMREDMRVLNAGKTFLGTAQSPCPASPAAMQA